MASAASSGLERGSTARRAAEASTTACWMTCQRSTAASWPPDSACISSNASRWARISSLRRSLNSSPAPSPKAKENGNSGGSSLIGLPQKADLVDRGATEEVHGVDEAHGAPLQVHDD